MIYKTCSKCGEEFEATTEFFSPNKQTKNGFVSHCKKCRNEYSRTYRKNNNNKVKEYWRKWRVNNPEQLKQGSAKWAKKNPEKLALIGARYRSRKSNQTPILTESEDKRIKLIYRVSQDLGPGWQVDHKIPLSKDGLHHPDNLQLVTKTYNLQKNDKLDFRLPTEKEIYKF